MPVSHFLGAAVYEIRHIVVLDVPTSVAIIHPEQIVLRFGTNTIDLGALCFVRRSDKPRKNNNNGLVHPRLVDLTSLDKTRCLQLNSLIGFASEWVASGGYRLETAFDHFKQFSRFMDWADSSGHGSVMAGGLATYNAFRSYIGHLRELVNQHKLAMRTAVDYQNNTRIVLANWLSIHDLHRGINLLQENKAARGRTEPAATDDIGRMEALCEALFNGFSDLVLNNRPYPFWVPMPKYLNWPEPGLWAFPAPIWGIPPHRRHTESSDGVMTGYAYDYANGKLYTFEEVGHRYRSAPQGRCAIKRTQRQFDEANSDPHNYFREIAAMNAHNAFVMLFLGQTGMNPSVAVSLPWGDEYKVGTAQQGFRQIKWRAGGKWYPAVVRPKFLPLFARFIELRKYLLNGRPCEYLFITLGVHRSGQPKMMDVQRIATFFGTLRKLDPELPRLPPRVLRASKDDFHLRNSDISITSKIMGRTEETTRTAYAAGSKSVHYEEMTQFLGKVQQSSINKTSVIDPKTEIPGSTDGHVGLCTKINSPQAIADHVPVQPDCKTQEGCLFCDKHRVHADERDTRKLSSCAFVVQQVIYVPGAEIYFQPVLGRIESLLDEIKTRDEANIEMVDRVVKQVHEEGDLDPYWAAKLALLESMEFIL